MWNPFQRQAPQGLSQDSPSNRAPRTVELGHALTSRTGITSEDNWELKFPQSPKVFAKMGREDAQVTSVLNALWLPIQRADWRIDPNGAPEEVVSLVSEDLRLPVLGDDPKTPVARRKGRVSWSEHLQQALLSLQYGVMFFEQVYEARDGRMHLVKLAPRYPGTLQRINVASDGGLVSVEQRGVSTGKAKADSAEIPVDHLVAYCHAPRDSTWEGTSVLRPAYKHWKLRDEALRLEMQVLDRNGMGVPVYKGSDLSNDPKSDLEYGQRVASELRSGAAAGASVPAGADLEIKGVNGQLVSPRESIAYHDSMIARSVLAHFLNLEGKGGSYALAETQSDLFIQSLQTIADWIADTATQHIVEDLVEVAFPGHDGLCPRIVVDPIASKKELSAQDLATLASAGVLQMDKDLEEHVRRVYSQPAKRPRAAAVADGTIKEDVSDGADAQELAQLAAATKSLVDAGVSQEDALRATGLDDSENDEPVTSPGEGVTGE
ncbi:phage portal protein family protein [Corynebacterium kalidii]